nr:zinc finger, CCHC-type, retrotransposon Gag domain protein [Tanacetum cinerariifolium]
QMVNTRTDTDLSAAVQNALQTLLPQIHEEIREEFRTGSGSSNASGNPTPERLKREYHSIRQTSTKTSTEFMQRFLRLAGFLGAAAGTEEEQAKNFQWGLRRQRSGDRHQPTSQQSSHRSYGHNNDRHGSDRRGGNDNHRGNNNNYSSSNNRHQGECRRAAGTCFKCGQADHLQKDCKKNTTTSTSGQADRKPGASGRVFAITEGQAANTS